MTDCSKCKDLKQNIKIRSPYELSKAIRVIKGNLEDKTIKQISKNQIKFIEIADNGPWDDILDYSFKCYNCGCKFDIFVESYHGSGGEWKTV